MSESKLNVILNELADCLDIPDSAYERAAERYRDLGEWFSRPDSKCSQYDPHIYSQGSFRLGTVINASEFDLDVGCRLRTGISKGNCTQEELKNLVGEELEDYRVARRIEQGLEEKNRCWCLKYKGQTLFHMDVVPSIPEDADRRDLLKSAMVNSGLEDELVKKVAHYTGAITDIRSNTYSQINPDWRVSNSEGYALWFESRMRLELSVLEKSAREIKAAKIESLPAFQWKSPLQKVVQILKCHRDRMFLQSLDSKPISIILTTLAARAYQGESNLEVALEGILHRMIEHVGRAKPRIPNPVNPAEDFADKWYDPRYKHLDLEENFRRWVLQAQVDFESLRDSSNIDFIEKQLNLKYGASIGREKLAAVFGTVGADISSLKTVNIITETPPKPWLGR